MASFIRKALEAEGFVVSLVGNGLDAVEALLEASFDAAVMDIMLPALDGLAVLRRIRAAHCTTPVLLVSARGHVDERIEGLNAGADDYLPKPFVLAELVARVRALSRRTMGLESIQLSVDDLVVDTLAREGAARGKDLIEVSSREYALLYYLLRNKGRVCTRMQILENVWDYHFDPGSNLVDVYIRRLREKIDAGSANKILQTLRGVGYILKEAE